MKLLTSMETALIINCSVSFGSADIHCVTHSFPVFFYNNYAAVGCCICKISPPDLHELEPRVKTKSDHNKWAAEFQLPICVIE